MLKCVAVVQLAHIRSMPSSLGSEGLLIESQFLGIYLIPYFPVMIKVAENPGHIRPLIEEGVLVLG